MGFFDFLFGKTKVEGFIGHYGLSGWWQSEFNDTERKRMLEKYQPIGLSSLSLIEGTVSNPQHTAVRFLSGMSAWFSTQENRPIAYKILEKAEKLIDSNTQILDIHFFYEEKINIFYKDRDLIAGNLDEAIRACEQQISCSKKAAQGFKDEYKGKVCPGHRGFNQLAIVRERQKKFEQVIMLCEQALSEGWTGDWEHRVNRCKKKMKSKKKV